MLSAILIASLIVSQPLSGPAVAPKAERPSIVQFDFNSRLRRPETSPEHAAAALLHLPAQVQSKVDEVLGRRAALIDRFVAENLFLLQELDTAGKAGDKLDQFVLIMTTLQKLRPVLEAGPLRDQVAAVLPGPDAASFRAMVDEYWRAATSEGVKESAAKGKQEARWAMNLGERFKSLGEEIARSYERQAASGTLVIDYFMTDLDLTPEQAATINGLKLDMLQRTGMRPSEKDQEQLVVGAIAYLNEAQRGKVIKRLGGK